MVPSLGLLLFAAGSSAAGYWTVFGHENDCIASMTLFLLAIAASCAAYIISLRESPGHGNGRNLGRGAIFAALCALTCAGTLYSVRCRTAAQVITDAAHVRCRVDEVTERRYDIRLLMSAQGAHGRARIIATAPSGSGIEPGDMVQISAQVRKIGDGAEDVNGYDLNLLREGIGYRTYLTADNWSTIERRGAGPRWTVRKALESRIAAIFSPGTSDFLKALYFGSSGHLDSRTRQDFKRAGVLHILAASGFNVSVIALLPLTLLGFFMVPRKIITAATIITIAGYMALTDVPVSLLRAVLMATVFSLFFIFDAGRNICNALFITGAIILVLFPHELYSLGFQLSFGATLGIILFFRFYKKLFRGLPGPLADSLALTFSAQLPVIPVIAVSLGELTVAGFLSNIAVIPVTTVIIFSSIGALAVQPLWGHASSALAAATDLLWKLDRSAIGFAASLDLHFSVPPFHPAVLIMLCMLSAPLFPVFRKKIHAIAVLLCGIFLPVALFSLSAGKAREIVFSSPMSAAEIRRQGRSQMITGYIRDRKTAQAVLKEATARYSDRLTLVIPDPDYENITSFSFIARNAPVTECVLGRNVRFSPSTERFFSILEKDGVRITLGEPLQ